MPSVYDFVVSTPQQAYGSVASSPFQEYDSVASTPQHLYRSVASTPQDGNLVAGEGAGRRATAKRELNMSQVAFVAVDDDIGPGKVLVMGSHGQPRMWGVRC